MFLEWSFAHVFEWRFARIFGMELCTCFWSKVLHKLSNVLLTKMSFPRAMIELLSLWKFKIPPAPHSSKVSVKQYRQSISECCSHFI